MKVILLTVMLSLAVAIEIHPEETHDHEMIQSDLENLRFRVQCALGKIACDEVNASYLDQFPKSLETACGECKPEAMKFMYAGVTAIKKYLPEEYAEILKKFDPEGKYMDKLIEVISKA